MTATHYYVICPETITSPAPSESFMCATGLKPNEPCGLQVPIPNPVDGPMLCRCARGHPFIAGPKDMRASETNFLSMTFRLLECKKCAQRDWTTGDAPIRSTGCHDAEDHMHEWWERYTFHADSNGPGLHPTQVPGHLQGQEYP